MSKIAFGVYVQTYPKDYDQAATLINSLRYSNPKIPVMIIPGNGFDRDSNPFTDVPILPEPDDQRWLQFEGWERKFWAFQGPFEKFMFVDADMICTRSIGKFVASFLREEETCFHCLLPSKAYRTNERDGEVIDDRRWRIDQEGQLGTVENIKLFDPEYAMYERYPFNSGLFAAKRSLFGIDELIEFRRKEMEFFASVLKKPFSWNSRDLFYGDQGKLNYLLYKKNTPLRNLYPHAHVVWGGDAHTLSKKDGLAGKSDYAFIHYAGAIPIPSHSLFCSGVLLSLNIKSVDYLRYTFEEVKSVPALDLWRHFSNDKSVRKILSDTWDDTMKITKRVIAKALRYSKSVFERICATHPQRTAAERVRSA